MGSKAKSSKAKSSRERITIEDEYFQYDALGNPLDCGVRDFGGLPGEAPEAEVAAIGERSARAVGLSES